MEITNSTKTYKTPTARVVEVKSQPVLCQSLGNTEKFGVSSNSYDENDWE